MRLPTLLLLALAVAGPSQEKQPLAELFLRTSAPVERRGEWVRCGCPIPEATALTDVGGLRLEAGDGTAVPARFRALSRWGGPPTAKDRPVKWLEVTFAADWKPGTPALRIVRGENAEGAVRVTRKEDGVLEVATGAYSAALRPGPTLFGGLRTTGGRTVAEGGGRVLWTDEKGRARELDGWTLRVESETPAAATILAEDEIEGLVVQARLRFVSGSRQIVVDFRLLNPGPYGHEHTEAAHVYLRRLGLTLPRPSGALEVATARGVTKVGGNETWALLQSHTFPTRRTLPAEALSYQVWHGARLVDRGDRARGAVVLSGASGRVACLVERFWENAPKSLAVLPDAFVLDLFPAGGSGPHHRGQYGDPWNGEVDARSKKAYRFEGARAKSTRILLEVGTPGDLAMAARHLDARADRPLHAAPSPAAVHASKALGVVWTPARSWKDQGAQRFERIMRTFVDDGAADVQPNLGQIGLPRFMNRGGTYGKQSFYGWFNYGDIAWGDGYSSLHYDWPFVMLSNYLRTGDARFFDLGREMARHRRDVDQDHDTRSEHKLRGGQFYEKGWWHGNYTRPVVSHTWPIGPLLHHLITGDEWSLEAALMSRAFLRRMGQDRWTGIWGARMPGWVAEHMLSFWWFLGRPEDLEHTRAIIANFERIEKKDWGGAGYVVNPRYKPVSLQPWMHNIFFNAVARHAILTGSDRFDPLMERMCAFFREHCLMRSSGGRPLLVYRFVKPPGLKQRPAIHLAWPMASSFAHAWYALGRPQDRALAVALFEGASRHHQGFEGGRLSPIAVRMMGYPGSESKILSNIGLWGVAPLSLMK